MSRPSLVFATTCQPAARISVFIRSLSFCANSREAQECACSLIEELPKGPYLSSGTRGERPASSRGTAGGGKPADNVSDGPSRKGPSGYPCDRGFRMGQNWPHEGTCVNVVTRRRGKWLIPSSQKARRLAHWFPGPMSATPLSARRKAGSYGLLSLLDGKSGNSQTA